MPTNTALSHIALSNGTIFAKNTDFLQKMLTSAKIKRILVLKGIFSETTYGYIHSTYQVSSF